MDTREKIVPIDSLRPHAEKTKVVIGYFDPFYAAHVARLKEIYHGEGLIVIVADRPNPILPLRARAELVASLACVHRVATCDGDPMNAAAQLDATDIIDQRDADERSAAELSARIIERYRE